MHTLKKMSIQEILQNITPYPFTFCSCFTIYSRVVPYSCHNFPQLRCSRFVLMGDL